MTEDDKKFIGIFLIALTVSVPFGAWQQSLNAGIFMQFIVFFWLLK